MCRLMPFIGVAGVCLVACMSRPAQASWQQNGP